MSMSLAPEGVVKVIFNVSLVPCIMRGEGGAREERERSKRGGRIRIRTRIIIIIIRNRYEREEEGEE